MSKRKASDLLERFNITMDAAARAAPQDVLQQDSPAVEPPEEAMQPAQSPGSEEEPGRRQQPRRTARQQSRAPTSHSAAAEQTKERPKTMPNELVRNLGVRARESLDNRLLELVHQLRLDGVRSSKAEIVEMLLWELPAKADEDFRKRLAEFKRRAPREVPL